MNSGILHESVRKNTKTFITIVGISVKTRSGALEGIKRKALPPNNLLLTSKRECCLV